MNCQHYYTAFHYFGILANNNIIIQTLDSIITIKTLFSHTACFFPLFYHGPLDSV